MSGATPDRSESRRHVDRWLRAVLPIAVLALGVVLWGEVVRFYAIPPYVLPGPVLVFETLVADWGVLSASLVVTLITTLEGFVLAVGGGVGLAVLFNQSRLIEYSLYPYAVILQVTPIVAFAALLLLSVAGVVIFFALSFVSHLMLRRWHESAIVREV